jgi:hypothetical protein
MFVSVSSEHISFLREQLGARVLGSAMTIDFGEYTPRNQPAVSEDEREAQRPAFPPSIRRVQSNPLAGGYRYSNVGLSQETA